MDNELNPAKVRKQARREKNRRKREREKARRTPKKKWDWVLIVALISLIVYKVTVNTINSYKLAAYGENQIAYVYAAKNARKLLIVTIGSKLMDWSIRDFLFLTPALQ